MQAAVIRAQDSILEIGMVHRALEPGNALLDDSTPRVVHFRLARSCRLKSVIRSVDIKGTRPYVHH